MNAPLKAPHKRPMRIPIMYEKASGYPEPARAKLVAIQADKARTAPTDRSMPPDTMTKVMPIAMIPITDICLNIFAILVGVRKTSELTERIANKTRNAI